jgi:hypothetical protein
MHTKHTPGPWSAIKADTYLELRDGSNDPILRIRGGMLPTSANARLIAAAPDLLAALENAANVLAGIAVGDLKTVYPSSPALEQARAAIAKAKGE